MAKNVEKLNWEHVSEDGMNMWKLDFHGHVQIVVVRLENNYEIHNSLGSTDTRYPSDMDAELVKSTAVTMTVHDLRDVASALNRAS